MASCSYTYENKAAGIKQTAKLTVTEKSYSVENNTSDITWKLEVSAEGSSTWTWAYVRCVVNGTEVYNVTETRDSFPFPARPGSTSGTISEITHNDDGSLSIDFSMSGWFYTSASPKSSSGILALTNIPRASTMTYPEFTAGQSGAFNISRVVPTYTHKIQYPIGTDIATSVGTSFAWTPPMSLCSLFPNATNGTIKVRLITYSGNTQIGYKDYDVTINVPSSVVPDFSFSLSEGTASGFGIYTSTLSTLRATLTSIAGSYGSTVKTAEMTVDGTTYRVSVDDTSEIINSNILSIPEMSKTVSIKITDSRGRTKIKTSTINVYEYFEPQVSDVDLDISGTTVQIKVSGSIAPVNNQNTKFIKIEKINTATQQGSVIVPRTAISAYNFNLSYTQTISDIGTTSYEFIVTLEDRINEVSFVRSSGVVCISRFAGGRGVRLFGEAYQDGFMVGNIEMDITDAQAAELDAW